MAPRVVIVGGGFGGLAAARALADSDVNITLIDKANHHLFQPLLYQVATAGLNPSDIAWPIRSILSTKRNVEVVLGEVTRIDAGSRRVWVNDSAIEFHFLVLATGVRHSYFGHPWEPYAPGLKTLEDALEIRQRVLLAFERAENSLDPLVRKALTTFVVVGGGPTGVELAGALAELAHVTLAQDFRHIEANSARIVLLEAGPRLLPSFREESSEAARRRNVSRLRPCGRPAD